MHFKKFKYQLEHKRTSLQPTQKGMSLVELLVGVLIGLIVVAVAMAALMSSRAVTSNVSDISTLQQQGSYVLRVFGQQLRQAGSLRLAPSAESEAPNDVLSPVIFEIKAISTTNSESFELKHILNGSNNSLSTGYRRYSDDVYINSDSSTPNPGSDYLMRNCIGLPANISTYERIESTFTLENNNLRCGGNGGAAQPIAQNVAELQFSYLEQKSNGGSEFSIQYISAAPADWKKIQGVQVCFVLYGNDPIDMPAGSSYTDCTGTPVDMTTLTGARKNRMHMLFRNTFQLRSQGLPIT